MNIKKIIAVLSLGAAVLLSGCGNDKGKTPEALLKEGSFEAASEGYIKLLEKDEKNTDLYIGLADSYVGMKEYEAAVDTLCEGYDITGKDELVGKMKEITGGLFKTASDKISLQTVIYCCERILECGESADMYEMIAKSYLKLEQPDKAVETVTVGVEETLDEALTGKITSELYKTGEQSYQGGKEDKALEYFGYVLELDPENEAAARMIDTINHVEEKDEQDDEKKSPEKTEPQPEPVAPKAPVTSEPSTPPAASEPSTPPAASEPSRTYTVQIGAYSELANAENKVAAANAAGLSASYFTSGGLYRVTIGTYSTESEANAAIARAVAAGFSAVIV